MVDFSGLNHTLMPFEPGVLVDVIIDEPLNQNPDVIRQRIVEMIEGFQIGKPQTTLLPIRWKTWRIGGSYRGRHDPNYDPLEDLALFQDCPMCDGRGYQIDVDNLSPENKQSLIEDIEELSGEDTANSVLAQLSHCPVCDRKGIVLSHSKSWTTHPRDLCLVEDLPTVYPAFACVTPDQILHQTFFTDREMIVGELSSVPMRHALMSRGLGKYISITLELDLE